MAILQHFEALTQRGLRVIPLWENSKIPMCKGWNENWSYNRTKEKILQYPGCNLGILLGDILDVEGDSKEANATILELIGDYPHPTYSSSKSIHHLFLNPSSIRIFKWNQIEFRGHGHQSVLPPSQHQGIRYQWMNDIFPVPEMPARLLGKLAKLQREKDGKDTLKQYHRKIWCSKCKKKCFLHEKRLKLEQTVFQLLGSKWECKDCRDLDVRPYCRVVKAKIGVACSWTR